MEYPDSKINLSWGMQHFLQLRCVKKFQESFLRSYRLPMTPHGNGQISPNLQCIWFSIVMCERKIYFWSFHWNWVYFQQAKKFSSSISEISSIYSKINNTRESLTSGFGVLSNPADPGLPKLFPISRESPWVSPDQTPTQPTSNVLFLQLLPCLIIMKSSGARPHPLVLQPSTIIDSLRKCNFLMSILSAKDLEHKLTVT